MGETDDPAGRLRALRRIAYAAGETEIVRDSDALVSRGTEGRFYVACVGQFKRGKSTLLNALVGASVLPTGVVPVTAIVTVLRFGRPLRIRVLFADGRVEEGSVQRLSEFVTEEGNPGNRRGVTLVEVFVPSSRLESGMCLVDTPGLGSVHLANEEATRDFVPHIDAAIVVLGADPPISGEELALAAEIARQAGHLLFVMNKADRLSDGDREEATRFAAGALAERLAPRVPSIYEVAATERLAGATTRDWSRFERDLDLLARESGAALVEDALRRGTLRLCTRLLATLVERIGALRRPLDESERRVTALGITVANAERSLADLGVLLSAERMRLTTEFSRLKDDFLTRERPAAREELRAALAQPGDTNRRARRSRAFAAAQETAERRIGAWRQNVETVAEKLYRGATERFVRIGNEFLERLASSGDAALAGLPGSLEGEVGFRVRAKFFHTEQLALTGRSPLGWLLDALRPPANAEVALRHKTEAYLDRLLYTNASRVASDLDDRVQESRLGLEREIRDLLREISARAERALELARARRESGESATLVEIERLESLRRDVERLLHYAFGVG